MSGVSQKCKDAQLKRKKKKKMYPERVLSDSQRTNLTSVKRGQHTVKLQSVRDYNFIYFYFFPFPNIPQQKNKCTYIYKVYYII